MTIRLYSFYKKKCFYYFLSFTLSLTSSNMVGETRFSLDKIERARLKLKGASGAWKISAIITDFC